MSKIPRQGGSGKPLIKTTSTTTTKIPGGGTKTTTTTKIRELQPCTYGDNKAQASGCQPCPSKTRLRPPQAGAVGGIRPSRQPAPPRGQPSRMPQPQAGPPRTQPPAAQPRRAPPPQARPRPPPAPAQMKPPMPGQYSIPAQYGPMSRAGKDMVYSSPADLRGRMEARVPKELKYEGIKMCPGARAMDRSALPGTTMADMFSGSFNVYGGGAPMVSEEMVGRNVLDERCACDTVTLTTRLFHSRPIDKTRVKMANKPHGRDTRKMADLPVAVDLTKHITSIFDLKTKKQERISDYMCRKIRRTKLRALQRMAATDVTPNVARPVSAKDIRAFSEKSPITEMSRFQEKCIRQKVQARGLEKRFPHILDDIMKDTKVEFRKMTHYAGINLKVKDKYPEDFTVKYYKLLGKTEHYDKFQCTKRQFEMRWSLHSGIMRNLLEKSVETLPYVLFDLKIGTVVDIAELQAIFNEKLSSSWSLLQDFHKTISGLFDNQGAAFKKRPAKCLPAGTGLFAIHVSRCIAHTMEGIVRFTSSSNMAPYLKLQADFGSRLVLTPTDREVIEAFEELLDSVVGVGRDLYVMERGRLKGYETKKIWLCLTEEFIKRCKDSVMANISEQYRPIMNYLEKVEGEFEGIYFDINSDNIYGYMDVLFEDGCQKIEYYKAYIRKVAYIPDNEYFKIGQLDLKNYRETLHASLQSISDSIFKNLSSQHLWEVTDICDSFRLIEIRATQKPSTTEELIEIGKFMSWVKNEQLDDLNRRVYSALQSLCNIIMLGPLEEEHMVMNSAAINWIQNILPIIEQHSTAYEQLKFEAEEKLQKVIEDINVMFTAMYPLLVILDEMDNIKLARSYLSKITLHMTKIKEIEQRIEWINKEEICLNFPKSTYVEFKHLKDYVYPFYHLLKLSLDVQKYVSVWQYGQFDLLNYNEANQTVEKFCKELNDIHKNYRKKLRQAQDENLPIRFKGTVDDPDMLNWPAPLKLCGTSLNILEEFKPSLTVMRIMCNKALHPRHWKAMSEVAGFNLMPNAGTTLKKMMELNLKDKLHEYEIISNCATKEQQLLDHLSSLKSQWEEVRFVVGRNERNVRILTRLEDVQTIIDDHLIKISNMRSSVFVKPYEADVSSFHDTISKISSVTSDWSVFQGAFLKLFPVFSLVDVAAFIPKEGRLLKECASIFDKYIAIIEDSSRVMDVVANTPIAEELMVCLASLEEAEKGVDGYLEVIKARSPRLFLVSNEELVNLIANEGLLNESFVGRIFPGVKRVVYNERRDVVALLSDCQEEIVLENVVKTANSNLEEVVNGLQKAMLTSLKSLTASCYRVFKRASVRELMQKYPQQSLQLLAKVSWTDQVETALKLSHNIKLLMIKKRLEESIDEKTNIVNAPEITCLQRFVMQNLLLTDLNNKYLLNHFVKDGLVLDDNSFAWLVQLKYYFQQSLCTIRVLNHSLSYDYEYWGNNNQIVLTPLTERCFTTLLSAYFFNSFALIRGADQTGKSATVKALAEALGKLYYVFSCISTLTSQSLLQTVKWSSLCGSWLTLKNVDRLKPDVLSVVSQELLGVVERKKIGASGDACFVLIQFSTSQITLPENLKVLFRTFALSQPDLRAITEGLSASKGAEEPRVLARSIEQCFALLGDLLHGQKHYDFNLRGVQRVLKVFESKPSGESDFEAIRRGIRDVFAASLVDKDLKVFEAILGDVFPAPELPCEAPIIERLHASQLSIEEEFHTKMGQVFNSLKANRSTILLGDTFTGKTTILKLCADLLRQVDQAEVDVHVINPKCLDSKDLIGETCPNKTVRWTDGVLLKILREERKGRKWILFDGHIDGSWASDLISVLDDGRLFLESLETLTVDNGTRMVFETTSLVDCSPSMISRCSTIYFSKDTLQHGAVIDTWLKTCVSDWLCDYRPQVAALLKWLLPPSIEALNVLNLQKYCNLVPNNIVNNTLIYFQLILDGATSNINKREEDPKNMPAWIHATVIQAVVVALMSPLTNSSRQKFDSFLKQLLRGQNVAHPYPNCLERLEVGVPSEGLLFDYCYLYKQRGTWKLWVDVIKNEKIVESGFMGICIVPTPDSVRCNYFMDLHIKYERSFMIIGPGGTGKSLALKDCYTNRLGEGCFETSLVTFRGGLQNVLDKGRSKRFVCFLDDVHVALRDLEVLRVHLDHDKDSTGREARWKNVTFIGASDCNGNLDKRFLRHFNVFGANPFVHDTLAKIYSQQLMFEWKKSCFPSDMSTAVSQIVHASLRVYDQVSQLLKPSLNKSHYVFDTASLSKVIQGCAHLKKETYDCNKRVHVKLWASEIYRVFGDRLYENDFVKLRKAVAAAMEECFGEEAGGDILGAETVVFGTFEDRDLHVKLRRYEEVNFQQLKELSVQEMNDFNGKSRVKLDLIFFDYALEKLAKLCRLLSMERENALMLGLPGCGRRSLSKFASFLYKHEFYQPTIKDGYDETQWEAEFMGVMRLCGGLDRKYVFLVEEEALIKEDFLSVIDYYARGGDVTNLYDADEKQELLELTRLAAQGGNRNLDVSAHKVFLYFNKKCRENFRLFVSLDSHSDRLRTRISQYPSLAAKFNLILFTDWPDSALRAIATNFVQNINMDETVKEPSVGAAIFIHRVVVATPKSFMHLIRLFAEKVAEKQEKLTLKIKRFRQGLAKLSYASDQMLSMQKALAEYQPQLADMTRSAIEMTEQIALETIEVERASALVRKDEKVAGEQAQVAQILKSECEAELAQAIPILEDAISALNTLKPSDITLVKSMKNPPDAIKLVMASVCVIKDVKPDRIPDPSTGRKTVDYWGPSKRILGDMNFLQTLKDFDKDHIKPDIMAKIRKEYLPHKDFKPHVVAKASSAAEGLCKWIIAMDMYDRVAKEVAPKKEKLNKAEREYASTVMVLNEKKEEVTRIEEKLAQLHVLLDEATKKQVKLQVEVDLCNKKLNSALKLIGSLSGERLKWTEAAQKLQKHYDVLAGDILLSCATICYLPSLNCEKRSELLTTWRNYVSDNQIPCTQDFDFTSVMSSVVEVDHWVEFGLPSDPFFIENAVIFNNSKHFCLLLDPHGVALRWIRNLKAATGNLTITKFTFNYWLRDLKTSVTEGKPILIKDTRGQIPACLNPLIYGESFSEGDARYIKLDGETVKVHQSFKLYLISTTHYSNGRLTLINFALTPKALIEDVLKTVVEIERPEIKRLSRQLTKMNRENKAQLKELESKILNTLCESDADILEDERSIAVLDESKQLTKVAVERQAETKELARVIEEFCARYVAVAEHAARLFFLVDRLRRLHPLYRFSLGWFKDVFFASILNAGRYRDLDVRCRHLCDTFSYDLHWSVAKGLFEDHKVVFVFGLGLVVAVNRGLVTNEEVKLFFGIGANEYSSKLREIERFARFQGLVKGLTENPEYWQQCLDAQSPSRPQLDPFQRLMLTQMLRPDKLQDEVVAFTEWVLDARFLMPTRFDMQQIYNESYSLVPVIFILTQGQDVLKVVRDFAKTKRVLHTFSHLSLAQGNLHKAEELIKKAQAEGAWVLLQNCHYVADWLNQLEQNLEEMDFENTSENFRLFLTIDSSAQMPLELQQNCIKIVNETPKGLKKNLLKFYHEPPITVDDFYYGCPGRQEAFAKLLYSLCNFHCVLVERRNVPNWNLPYNFDESHLLLSMELLRNFINEQTSLHDKILHLIGGCNYNACLRNWWERNFVAELLKDVINNQKGLKNNVWPPKSDRRDFLQHINNLPDRNPPEALYLTSDQLAQHNIDETRALLSLGLKIMAETYLEDDVIENKDFKILITIDDLLNLVPKKLNAQPHNVDDLISNEIPLHNQLLQTITCSLHDLRSVFQGNRPLTKPLEEMALDLLSNKVPTLWTRWSYPTLQNLRQFAEGLRENHTFFNNYLQTPSTKFPLKALYFPRALIASKKLAFAKKHALNVADVDFNYHTVPNKETVDECSLIFENLFLFGASYNLDKGEIEELSPQTHYSRLPPLIVEPVASKQGPEKGREEVECCIFKTRPPPRSCNHVFLPGTQNFVTSVRLGCSKNGAFWVKRGVYVACEVWC